MKYLREMFWNIEAIYFQMRFASRNHRMSSKSRERSNCLLQLIFKRKELTQFNSVTEVSRGVLKLKLYTVIFLRNGIVLHALLQNHATDSTMEIICRKQLQCHLHGDKTAISGKLVNKLMMSSLSSFLQNKTLQFWFPRSF